jgi:phosphohistidine phosphatase
MKRLCLIRHAKSDWGNESLHDIDRHLNARGYEDAHGMSLRLKSTGHKPDAMFSSTAIRAASTALIFSRTFAAEPHQMHFTPTIYDARPQDLLKVIGTLPDSLETVFLFGHNPSITSVANELANEVIVHMPTCAIVLLEQDCDSWTRFKSGHLTLFDFPKKGKGL